MEYREGYFLQNNTQQDSAANFHESTGFPAASNTFLLTNPTTVRPQEVSTQADLPLVQVSEYRLMTDLNEGNYTGNDELYAQTAQIIPQYANSGPPIASGLEADHPQLFSNSVPVQTHQNGVFHVAAESTQQRMAAGLDALHHTRFDSLEVPFGNVQGAVIENSSVQNLYMDQIGGEQENVGGLGYFYGSEGFSLANEAVEGLSVQQLFPLIDNVGPDANLRSPFPRTTLASINDDGFHDQLRMSPEAMHFMFVEQETDRTIEGPISEVGNVPLSDQNELQDQEEISFLDMDELDHLGNAEDSNEQETEQRNTDLLLEDGISEGDLSPEQFSENGENLTRDQTAMATLADELQVQTSADGQEYAERLRVVFLYPMYKQMKEYQKRFADSPRAKNVKYYARKRLQQDIRENLEIAQKASIVSRLLQLERERVQRDIASEKQEVRRLRGILERYAVGRRA